MGHNKLYSETIKVKNISKELEQNMFKVFSKYYENVSYVQFSKDLKEKDAAFVLFDRKENIVRGFSTIVKLDYKGKKGLFSGDTIIEKEFWGQGTLGVAFLKYLFIEKMKRPFSPLYWFLISKGFKTYLLMANNFDEHWPRFERNTDVKNKEILDGFSQILYPKNYDREKGVITFKNESKDHLKECVAPITQKMINDNNRIAFFAQTNPGWEKGDELCCIAKMSLLMPLKYQLKAIKKQYLKSSQKKRQVVLPIATYKKS